MIVCQWGNMESDCRALSLRGCHTEPEARDQVELLGNGSITESHASCPKDADMVTLKRAGAISAWTADNLDSL